MTQMTTKMLVMGATTALWLAATPAAAGDRMVHRTHVRTADATASWYVDAGATYSLAFRRTVERLESTDVVAYVVLDGKLPRSLGGKISFVGAAAGLRYVLISMMPDDNPVIVIGLMGHELTHALEIASDPSIVDTQSMASSYLADGIRHGARTGTPMVDTHDARTAGNTVLRELRGQAWAMRAEFEDFVHHMMIAARIATR